MEMSKEDLIGIASTLIVIVGAAVIWQKYNKTNLGPNDVAEFYAGVVSAIALIWLVLGYLVQRRELSLQRREFSENTKAQKEQVNAMAKQAESLERTAIALADFFQPYVTFSLEYDGYNIIARVRNDGVRSAHNVSVSLTPPLEEFLKRPHDISTVMRHGILPPGSERAEVAGFGPTQLHGSERALNIQTLAKVKYADESGKEFSTEHDISLSQTRDSVAQRRTVRSALHAIADALGDPHNPNRLSISKQLEKIAAVLSENVDGKQGRRL